MSQPELLKKVVEVLNRLQIDYMITGSMASSLQGEPRASHDIDLVVDLRPSHIKPLLLAFQSPDFYLEEIAILEALEHKSMFNLLHTTEGDKVDFWILTDEPFDKSRFARKYAEKSFQTSLNVSSPEDTILAKLRWAKKSGGSEKQFIDALRIYEVQYPHLDQDYLLKWSKILNIESLLQELKNSAKMI
jgi:hypothetical protein